MNASKPVPLLSTGAGADAVLRMLQNGRAAIEASSRPVAAAHPALSTEAAIRRHISHPQLRVVPRHVGVLPGHPRQPALQLQHGDGMQGTSAALCGLGWCCATACWAWELPG